MQKGLVSILTPCYNTGSIVHRLLDSILAQDYPSVEMYAINDGSNDNTEEVIKSYIPKFESRGYRLTYIYQDNSGQSAAINNGLKLVNGEFLVWSDSDDFFRVHNALTMFVDALKGRDNNYGVVRCYPVYVDENTLEEAEGNLRPADRDENQFVNCLHSENFFWGAGNYLVRTSAFNRVNPTRTIYVEKDAGQNWQLLLPVLYSYKCLTIEKSVFCVLERSNSHSRGQYKTYEQLNAKFNSYCNTIVATLDTISSMPEDEREAYKRQIRVKYKMQELYLAFKYKKSEEKKRLINELNSMGTPIPFVYIFKLWLKHTTIGKILSWLHIKLYTLSHKK